MQLPKRILVPIDFSPYADAAVELAVELARPLGARVDLLHIFRPPAEIVTAYELAVPTAYHEDLRAASQAQLDAAVAKVHAAKVEGEGHLRDGAPADAICDQAREIGADLIVMGTRGRTGLAHVLLGSVAQRVLKIAPCPVLTVRASYDND